MNKKNDWNYLVFAFSIAGVYLLLTRSEFIYGSQLDWDSQYVQIADYLRNLYYDTHELFPSYALNLGGGTNIYYYSFYGLLNPLILFSYLLPSVPMQSYIIVMSLAVVFTSTSLFYIFMKRKVSKKTAFIAAMIFLFAVPILFHSHRQLVFTNYMPFLILSLISLDSYVEKKRITPLIFSLFLLIMTNYYFSVSCIFVLIVYANYLFLKEKIKWQSLITANVKLYATMFVSVMMSAVLLLPTAFCIMMGRSESGSNMDWLDLFLPGVKTENLFYSNSGMGLTAVFLAAVVFAFLSKERRLVFMGMVFAVCGGFQLIPFILNGTMYETGKTLIPLMPVAVMVIGLMIEESKKCSYSQRHFAVIYLLLSAATFLSMPNDEAGFFATDAMLVFVLLISLNKRMIYSAFAMFFIITPILAGLFINSQDGLVKQTTNREVDLDNYVASYLVDYAQNSEESLYRFANNLDKIKNVNQIYNMDYLTASAYSSLGNKYIKQFFYDGSLSGNPYRNSAIYGLTDNILYHFMIGDKYLLSKNTPPRGYSLVKSIGETSLYENDDVLPIGYSTAAGDFFNRILDSKEEFNIEFPTGIVKKDGQVSIKEKESFKLEVPENLRDKILIVTMDVDNSRYLKKNTNKWGVRIADDGGQWGDVTISINGYTNKLTNPNWKYYNNNSHFTFVVSRNKAIKNLKVTLSAGDYKITNVHGYYLDYNKLKEARGEVSELIISSDSASGNTINGYINAKDDGVLTLSLPMEAGYKINIDGNPVPYYQNEQGFICADITKGSHNVSVTFESTGRKAGILISLAGAIIFAFLIFISKKKSKSGSVKQNKI